MRVAASQAVTDNFLVKNSARELVDADSLPTAVLYRKGAATAVTVTVESVTGTGKYSFAFTNGAYDSGDPIWIEVTATVSGKAYTAKVWEATVDVAQPTTAEIAASVAPVANQEMLDVLTTDTFAEPGSVPAATSSLKDKINWLFMLARNKLTQTSTTQTVYADDGTTSVATSDVSDDGTTATRGKHS